MTQTLEQKRARHALEKVRRIAQECPGELKEKFVSRAEGLPATILTNGLGQAMATLLAEGKESAGHLLYRILEEWLCRSDQQAPYRGEHNLMNAIVAHDRAAYLRAQAEAFAYLEWLKKFAVAFLK